MIVASLFLTSIALASSQTAPLARSVRQYRGLALSPAGDRVATVDIDETADTTEEQHGPILVRAVADGAILARIDPCPACSYTNPTWSPDGASLAVVARDAKAGTATLTVVTAGRARTLALIAGVASTPRWSPDGQTVALLATPGARKKTGATQPAAPQVGEIGGATDEQRIAVVALSGGALRYVSPADTYIYEYDWTADGKSFVATAAKGDGDRSWWTARLEVVDLATGALRELATPKTQLRYPRAAPDGSSVAFIGGLMSDFGPTGGDVYVVPAAGGSPKNLTPGFRGSFSSIAWRGRNLIATALVGADQVIATIDPASGALRTLWSASLGIEAGDGRVALSRDGSVLAMVTQTFSQPPHIVAGPIQKPTPITHENDPLPPGIQARTVSWTNEGFNLSGWLLAPPNAPTAGRAPLVVEVHGGPSAARQPSYLWKGVLRALLDHGYYVFAPNPRGSHGQGEAFTRANVRDFGGGDFRDILTGVDAVEKLAPVDDRRLGIFGASYGGFMSMWAVTHTTRFKAAVAGAGIANWVSYYGQSGIDEWMMPFFGASVYDDAAAYRAVSPIESVKRAKTPTFIYVGERDLEVPPPQSLEFWHGLTAMGVPTSLVIYPGEGHAIREPKHMHDLEARVVAWFERYLAAE
jgi:dipeptidyl aminopeptidase/acylaminoacyl peptidase